MIKLFIYSFTLHQLIMPNSLNTPKQDANLNLTLNAMLINFLSQHIGQSFTAKELALAIIEKYSQYFIQKQRNSQNANTQTAEGLANQVAAEIGAHKTSFLKHAGTGVTKDRPRRYFIQTTQSANNMHPQANSQSVKTLANLKIKTVINKTEASMYPLLANYLRPMGIYIKRIDEKRSSNSYGSKGNHWLHPDMVGIEDLGENWLTDIKDCVKQYADKRTKLWSFEVKRMINRSNVRECFFQTLSNSSWANVAYLVTAEIDNSSLIEMQLLANSHGIGLIHLNTTEIEKSTIVIKAKEKNNIDWDMVNRLAKENKDFYTYITLVKQFYQTNQLQVKNWQDIELD